MEQDLPLAQQVGRWEGAATGDEQGGTFLVRSSMSPCFPGFLFNSAIEQTCCNSMVIVTLHVLTYLGSTKIYIEERSIWLYGQWLPSQVDIFGAVPKYIEEISRLYGQWLPSHVDIFGQYWMTSGSSIPQYSIPHAVHTPSSNRNLCSRSVLDF